MIAKARCNKCGATGKFDMGDDIITVEQAQTKLNSVHIQSCPFGHHMELSDLHYTVIEMEPGHALSDEQWLATMRADRDLWTTDQLQGTEIRIESFALGLPLATVRGQDFWLDMMTSPEGHRHYYAPKGAYELALAGRKPTTVG